jgi:succinate dehydrogenase/fumarate reductase-like Fe-S protein
MSKTKLEKKDETPEVAKIDVHIMGKKYEVPFGLTIMEAIEYAGYRFTRGAGCRAGFCGACATVYRIDGDYKLKGAIACQSSAEDGMYLAQIPFTPANRIHYELDETNVEQNPLVALYPELSRCVSCNTCSKACPQELKVMDYVQAALRGDIRRVSELSFDCIQCGLCSMRCPAEIPQYHVAQAARRMYAKYMIAQPEELQIRIKQIDGDEFTGRMDEFMELSTDDLTEIYIHRKEEGVN